MTANLPASPAAASSYSPAKPFFRRTDWLAFFITFGCVWLGYYLTLAPELTLEDSGELATGSFYAGIPHPPGYPVWTIYTWLWTVLVPFKNVAWRVALGEATSGALAAGLLGLLVSCGSGLMIRGIGALKELSIECENLVCLLAGFVAGLLLGFNGFMWSQSVIVEVYSFSLASFVLVLLCLLRWMYAPNQRRYLYLALFFHGICFTNHQTLIVAAMGIEVAIAASNFRMGRYLFLGNGIIYICGLILKQAHVLTALDQNPAIFVIFNIVGVSSLASYIWFTFLSRESGLEYGLDASLAGFFIALALLPTLGWVAGFIALLSLGLIVKLGSATRSLGLEWLVVIGCGLCWILGALFYFYMPLAGMTNPPMEWGYPRTVAGFIHAFTRGQYEKTHPTDILHDPMRFLTQLSMLGDGIIEEFNWVYALLALIPFFFFFKAQKRERAWLIGLAAIYFCLGILLLILLNPPPDRAAQQLVRVFFTASHTIIATLVGYGVALIAAYALARYETFRFWGLSGGAVAAALAVLSFAELTCRTFFGETASVSPGQLLAFVGQSLTQSEQFALPVYAGLALVGMTLAFLWVLWRYRNQVPRTAFLVIFALMPLHSVLTHWADNEQHEHWFGYYFGHDMFKPPFSRPDKQPLYPEMPKNAVLFGGTDPGRFCPTYMIFCESFLPHHHQPKADRQFDRRDVYIITQNALADETYQEYIRAQYNRSQQIDPPFFQELFRSEKERLENTRTNSLARLVQPLDDLFEGIGAQVEKRRRTFTSWFSAADFPDLSGLADQWCPRPGRDSLSSYLYDQLQPDTQAMLSSRSRTAKLPASLARDLNAMLQKEAAASPLPSVPETRAQAKGPNTSGTEPLYTPARFQTVSLSPYLREFISQSPQGNARIRLDRLLLEAAYPKLIAKSLGGVYPDREIYIPTPEDSAECFSEYAREAQRRLQLNQLRPGEEVTRQGDRIQISGPSAVMGINGLITKVIFDHNPNNDFFVEESFPLDWMYPHLMPYGIIMEIHRQPLAELSQEVVTRDHEFWSRYCDRLIGNWITYDTSAQEIARWSEQVYLRKNFKGFRGDRKFIRDDQAQKSFSKLRSAIAGVYNWRIVASKPGSPQRARMIKEADFAFRQAFALCPYNPEPLFRYVNLLLSPEVQRVDDALVLAKTSQRLDPNNASFADLVNRLTEWKAQRANLNPARLEEALRANPGDYQAALNLATEYFQLGQTNAAVRALDQVLNASNVPTALLRSLVPLYSALASTDKLQQTVNMLAGQYQNNPVNLSAAVAEAEGQRALNQPQAALKTLDSVLKNPAADENVLLETAQLLVAMADYGRLEMALERLTQVAPNSAENWYDLAALRSIMGKSSASLEALRHALQLSAERRARDPKARDLFAELQRDPRFKAIRSSPEFQQLLKPK